MCDMQKMPSREDASCEEEAEMNFAAFQAVGGAGTHFVTTGGQIPMAKLQQNVGGNSTHLQQVVGMVGNDGSVQYVRAVEGGPQLISVPIALPGAKPGDPQPTVQIQVLSPNMLQPQQPKYQMQIPIQGFQQGGAVLTLAYAPENSDAGGIQLIGNTLPDGLQVVTMPQEMTLVQPQTQEPKEQQQQQHIQHQVLITPNQQIIINTLPEGKVVNNNTSCNNNNSAVDDIIIKEECDDNNMDDESSQGTEVCETLTFQSEDQKEVLMKYLNQLPQQNQQLLPVSLQQFLKLNPSDSKKVEHIQFEVGPVTQQEDKEVASAVISEDGTVKITKKKKKYKKKPPRLARPKPGQVIIAQADDGTPIYCCPECELAYPEKEQLEMHLSVHKIERRFICGICGAGLKRKEHLERHKLGHNPERPFVCSICCKGFKRREHLNLHSVIHSGVKTEMCTECGKGFYRKDHLRKHTRSHEHRRIKEESQAQQGDKTAPQPTNTNTNNILPEITIHVPTSANMNVPVHINIPQHVVSSLAAAQQHAQHTQQHTQHTQQHTQHTQQHTQQNDHHTQLDALLS